jgi:pimeloyl-ACP methyl ester carboxylesterase
MAHDLERLLGHLDIQQAHVVGHSYGGAVALHHAVLYPERVVSLTLADARVRCLQPSLRLAHWPKSVRQPHLKNLGIAVSDGPEMGLELLETLASARERTGAARGGTEGGLAREGYSPFGLSRGRDRTAKQWLTLLHTTTARREFEQVAGLTVERLREVKQPVLAIFGEHSPCLSSLRGLRKTLADCRVVMVPDAGHFHPVVRPKFFAGAVQAFIDEVGRRW